MAPPRRAGNVPADAPSIRDAVRQSPADAAAPDVRALPRRCFQSSPARRDT
jgi:hypothetical protein